MAVLAPHDEHEKRLRATPQGGETMRYPGWKLHASRRLLVEFWRYAALGGQAPSHFEQSRRSGPACSARWRLSTFLGNGLCLAQPPHLTRALSYVFATSHYRPSTRTVSRKWRVAIHPLCGRRNGEKEWREGMAREWRGGAF